MSEKALSILHVMRSPVGGLFRHVCDLSRRQAALGQKVGIVADLSTGGERAEKAFGELGPLLPLGVTRIAMPRELGPGDWTAGRHVATRLKDTSSRIVHGHGSKGGAYARLLAGRSRIAVYTPHGGSLNYSRKTLVGYVYLTLEQLLAGRTDLFLFESAHALAAFRAKVTEPKGLVRIVHNGLAEDEFADVVMQPDATDLLFLGELRHLKGVDVLLNALKTLKDRGRRLTATLVGAGPDAASFKALSVELGLTDDVRFTGALPARQAFTLGRIMVMPSRAESLPYVVLEAGAAGLPVLATRVGGVHEIFGDDADRLFAPNDVDALVASLERALDDEGDLKAHAQRLRERIKAEFSVEVMTEGVLSAYGEALARKAH
jgi:glycosyltransferase involved in cell wall biosynthesis